MFCLPTCHHPKTHGRLGLLAAGALLLCWPGSADAADDHGATRQLFARLCVQCHGADGRGAPGRATMPATPDFTDRAWQEGRTDVQLTISILEGKNEKMPANRGPVNEDQAGELVAFIRTFGPAPEPPPPPPPPPAPLVSRPPVGPTPGRTVLREAYKATGNFNVDMTNLRAQLADLRKEYDELAQLPPEPAAPVVAAPVTPPRVTPPRATPPRISPPPAPPAPAPGEAKSPAPVFARAFTPDEVARGRDLFVGHRPLANGGPACITCHSASGSGMEGGRVGPELTKVYERVGGRTALNDRLRAISMPTMQPVYQQHALNEEDARCLVAFLEEADRQGVEQASPRSLAFVFSLGGTVLGLALLSALLGGLCRFRRGRPATDAAPRPASEPPLAAGRNGQATARFGPGEGAEKDVGLGL